MFNLYMSQAIESVHCSISQISREYYCSELLVFESDSNLFVYW